MFDIALAKIGTKRRLVNSIFLQAVLLYFMYCNYKNILNLQVHSVYKRETHSIMVYPISLF